MDRDGWIGSVGDVWASEWRRTDRSFAGLVPHLNAAILARAPGAGIAVDVGSGAGGTALALAAARPGLSVIGIDLSPALVAVARGRASGLPNLAFRSGLVEEVVGEVRPVDLIVSHHGVLFFADPVAGLRALRASASLRTWLVFSCFGDVARNGWASETMAAVAGGPPARPGGYAPGPFGFSDPGFVAGVLDRAGWRAEPPEAVEFAYRAGAGNNPVVDALDFFKRIGPVASLLRALPPGDADAATVRLRMAVERRARPDGVDFPAMAWLWSARAV
ncbi:methyltransferase domain-containing protein [Sphingomonas bacterium]|uniref:methyltransferase domain-containing protein n=1 Tax=Sphingomonas bacterium TaxID=1895847 RepID=UPI00157778A4|nr:class I SAM-dependent methyltransferase [Sphingomonas bacterium]